MADFPGFPHLSVVAFHADLAEKYATRAQEAFMCGDGARYAKHLASVEEHIEALKVRLDAIREARAIEAARSDEREDA